MPEDRAAFLCANIKCRPAVTIFGWVILSTRSIFTLITSRCQTLTKWESCFVVIKLILRRARARIFDCQLSEEFARRFHYLIGGRLKRKVALIILPFFYARTFCEFKLCNWGEIYKCCFIDYKFLSFHIFREKILWCKLAIMGGSHVYISQRSIPLDD